MIQIHYPNYMDSLNHRVRQNTFLLAITIAIFSLTTLNTMAGGWVDDAVDGKTVIHISVQRIPNPNGADANSRARYANYLAFIRDFPELFAHKYRDRYKAAPEKYGRHNWDNVEVQVHPYTGITLDGVESDLLGIAGGMAPDVLYINFRKSDNYIMNNFLYPLDKPEDGYLSAMTKEETDFRIYPKLWPVMKRTGPDGKTHVWTMPTGGVVGKVLLFRKSLFDEKCIPYPNDKWTWDDMYEAAKKLTEPSKGVYGINFLSGKHESWNWCTYLWSADGEVMEKNSQTGKWTCLYDSMAGAEALNFYLRLIAEKWVDSSELVRYGYASKATEGNYGVKWDRGEIGMMISYIDEKVFSTINPDLVGMAPLPLGPTGIRGGEFNSGMWGLFSEIKDPVVRDAAWEYMIFSDSKEAQARYTKVMVEGGLGPFINPKYLRMFGYPEIERLCPKGWSKCFETAIESGRPEPYGPNSNFAYDMMTEPIQEAEQMALRGELPEGRNERLAVLQGLLKKSCARANEIMLGEITSPEKTKRRIVAGIVLAAIVLAFALIFRRIFKIFTPEHAVGKGWGFIRYSWAYLLLIPAVITILTWQYLPLARGSLMAFLDYKLIGSSTFVGLDNFGNLIFDSFWWTSVWNSFRYSFLVIVLTFIPPILLAILLQEVPKGSVFFRIIYYLPAVNTGIVTLLLWKQFYEPSEKGMLNSLLMQVPAVVFLCAGIALLFFCLLFTRRLLLNEMRFGALGFAFAGLLLLSACVGLAMPILWQTGETWLLALQHFPARLFQNMPEPQRWLGDPKTALVSCILPMLWAGVGPGCLIYLAALKGIPEDYYEAAEIDGASEIDKILFIVFPMLRPLIVINFVGVFIGSWYSSADTVLALTGGGAGTEVAGLHIWYKAFTYLNFGSATAAAWMLGFMLIGFTVYQLQMLSKLEFKAATAAK